MHIEIDDWKEKCTACGEEVTYPNWKCKKRPGNHKVAEKTYFHLGGGHLQNWRERRQWSPQMILKAGREVVADPRTGETVLEPTLMIVFSGQQYITHDPEIQFLLETKGDDSVMWGPEGVKAWQKTYLTGDQQKSLAEAELAAVQRQIVEQNELLAQVQKRTPQPRITAQ